MTHIWKRSLHRCVLQYPISLLSCLIRARLSLQQLLSLSVSRLLCSCSLTDNVLPSFTPTDSLTNHVAWQCLLSNATNQADSEGPEVNRHGHNRDGRQPIRLYWFKRIAPHLGGIYQCVNCPLANHKSPAPARPLGFTGNPEDWRDSMGRIHSK